MMGAQERYGRDPVFRTLVDHLRHALRSGAFTPTEMREAAMLAMVIHESETIRPITIDDVNRLRDER